MPGRTAGCGYRGGTAGKTKHSSVKIKEGIRVHRDKGNSRKDVDGGKIDSDADPPPPLTVPLFCGRVISTAPPPVAGYLQPHPGGALGGATGVVACDPSTGVPLVGPLPQLMVPLPPCVRMPSAIPLGHTPGSPPPAAVPAARREDVSAAPSVADVGLQTSLSEDTTPPHRPPQLIREVHTYPLSARLYECVCSHPSINTLFFDGRKR